MMTIVQAAARVALFDRLIRTRGRTEAQQRVYGNDTSGQLYRDRAAVAALARTVSPAASRVLLARAMPPSPPRVAALTAVNDRAERRADSLALKRFIAMVPALAQHGSAPTTPSQGPSIASFAGARQYETPVTNPAATAAAISIAGERGRAGSGSARPAPQPTGLGSRIVAAGRRRRGEI
jgi:hypothetical protein